MFQHLIAGRHANTKTHRHWEASSGNSASVSIQFHYLITVLSYREESANWVLLSYRADLSHKISCFMNREITKDVVVTLVGRRSVVDGYY